MAATDLSLIDLSDEDTYVDVTKIDDNFDRIKVAHDATVTKIDAETQRALDAEALLVSRGFLLDPSTDMVLASRLPKFVTFETVPVANQTAMLALTTTQVQVGDLAIRTDTGQKFLLGGVDPSQLANWVEIEHTDAVTMVQGRVGAVTINLADVTPVGGIPKSSLATAVQNQLDRPFAAQHNYARSGHYIGAPSGTLTALSLTGQNNVMFLSLVPLPRDGLVLSSLAAKVTVAGAAGSVLRYGVYTSSLSGTDNFQLLYEATTASQVDATTTGVKEVTFAANQTLSGYPLVWFAVVGQGISGTGPSLTALGGALMGYSAAEPSQQINGFFLSGVSGAMPATISTFNSGATTPRLVGKVTG